MGFNKRFVNYENSLKALENNQLKKYYGKSDALLFEDSLSSYVYELHIQGLTEKQILSIIRSNELDKE